MSHSFMEEFYGSGQSLKGLLLLQKTTEVYKSIKRILASAEQFAYRRLENLDLSLPSKS